MARYRNSVCKQCRREQQKLFLKGSRCLTEKCSLDRKKLPPGAARVQRKPSDYALQLREKQKLRRMYGVLERQFRKYFDRAARKKGMTGVTLLQMLECRLDNVAYRGGFALSRPMARQIVLHGHLLVNGKNVNIPSYQVKAGDEISVKEKSKNLGIIAHSIEVQETHQLPAWIQTDPEKKTIKVALIPTREMMDIPVEEQIIVELYSK